MGLALIALALFMLTGAAHATSEPDPDPAPEVNAVAAYISALSKTTSPGKTFTIDVVQRFPVTSNEPLIWTTSSTAVATVAFDAGTAPSVTVNAIKNGRATISLMGTRTQKTVAKCYLTVKTVKITSFVIYPKSLTLAPGRNVKMTAGIKPSSATYDTVTWTCDRPDILSFSSLVPQDTLETARGETPTVYAVPGTEGRATLKAETNTGKRAYRTVTVKNLSITKVTLPKTKTLYYDAVNPKATLTAVVSPSLAASELIGAVKYASSKPEIAAIDERTGELTPVAAGYTYVTAAVGGKTSNRCKVTVVSNKPIKSLSISTPDGSAVVLNAGENEQLTAVASPSYAVNRSVAWSSEEDAVATVDPATGLVTAVGPGITRVTVKSLANARVYARITVRVRGGDDVKTVTLTAAGDAVLGGDQRKGGRVQNPRSFQAFKAAIYLPDDGGANPGDGTVFRNVASYFAGGDNIVTMNLEGTLTYKDTRDTSKPFVFQGYPEYAKRMLKAHNIRVVNIANNHTYDVGKDGYEGTMRALDKAGVRYCGNGITRYVKTTNGVRVAFLGFVSKKLYSTRMVSEIKSAAKKYDMVVVHFHWTGEREFRYAAPSSRQRSLSQLAIRSGADLVVGHHTHRLNTIERYRGKYIVYDLGNFVSIASNQLNTLNSANPRGKYDYDSLIYQQKFNIWSDGYVEPADIKLVPCSITSSPKALVNNCQPTPYTDSADIERVKAQVAKYNPAVLSSYPITWGP